VRLASQASRRLAGRQSVPPLVWTLAGPAAFGRDHEILRIGVESLRDEPFADTWAVDVGCVDQVHAELDRSLEDTRRLRWVAGLAPRPGARQSHRAEAESADRNVADHERIGDRLHTQILG
jgi:hypothetical protein